MSKREKVGKPKKQKYPQNIRQLTPSSEVSYTAMQVTPIHTYTKETVSYTSASNNRSAAACEAFRILLSKKKFGYNIAKFDMNLCQMLVAQYSLSCSDCHIEECENHGLDQFR